MSSLILSSGGKKQFMYTIVWEIFVVNKFSYTRLRTKIKRANFSSQYRSIRVTTVRDHRYGNYFACEMFANFFFNYSIILHVHITSVMQGIFGVSLISHFVAQGVLFTLHVAAHRQSGFFLHRAKRGNLPPPPLFKVCMLLIHA